jgi:hypothetical protein
VELHVSLARPCSNRGLLPLPLPYLSTGHADVLRLLHLEGARREGSNAPQQRQQALLDVLEGTPIFIVVCCGRPGQRLRQRSEFRCSFSHRKATRAHKVRCAPQPKCEGEGRREANRTA